MLSKDLDYDLPQELIAQQAIEPRDAARLLVYGDDEHQHRHVRDLPSIFRAGDLLVLNRTTVIPARLPARKQSGGMLEVLLVHPLEDKPNVTQWRCIIRGKVRPGMLIFIADTPCTVVDCEADGHRIVEFPTECDVLSLADEYGSIPLPPYIKREATENDASRYQTVFGDTPGSVAAPTASLHFTSALLQQFADMGIEQSFVELRVGPGTFKPVEHDTLEDHPIHAEWCQCPPECVDAIQACRARGGRVIAVGTTVIRTLESAMSASGLQPWSGWTQCFLMPPKVIHSADLLLTNFHLPRSTLLALVACMVGLDGIHQAYASAIARKYRFFSYGDAMLLPNLRRGLAPGTAARPSAP